MDELDRKIVAILEENGRASNASVARQLGVSEGTVRRRLNRLIREGYIRVQAIPEPQRLGYETEAIIGIQADPGQLDAVAGELARMKETLWVATTTGAFDIFAWVVLMGPDQLADFLKNRVGTIPGVRRTETFVSLGVKKRTLSVPV